MSSDFSLSHQFSQRWLNIPAEVKRSIIQELEDIICLLQEETDLNTFRFRSELNNSDTREPIASTKVSKPYQQQSLIDTQEDINIDNVSEKSHISDKQYQQIKQEIVHSLQQVLDDYLKATKEDLLVWLQDEVDKQLKEQLDNK